MKLPLHAYWRLLRRYLAPQRAAVLWMALLLLARTGAQIVGPQVVRGFIDTALAGGELRLLTRAGLVLLLIQLFRAAAGMLATYWSRRVAWTATNGLRADLSAHLLRLDLDFFQAHPPGELIERVDGDVGTLADFFSVFCLDLLGALLLLVGLLVALYVEDVLLALLLTAFGGLAVVFFAWLRRFAPPHIQADRACQAGFWGYVGEVLGATEDVRACGAEGYVKRRFMAHLRAWLPVNNRANAWGASMWLGEIAAGIVLFSLVRGLGASTVREGRMTLGTLFMLLSYAEQLLRGPLGDIGGQLQTLQHAEAGITRVRELLHTRSRLDEGAAMLPDGALAVEFRDVRFAYPSSADNAGASPVDGLECKASDNVGAPPRQAALDGISFHLPAGRTLGLLGRTGSGKTTLGRLLYRFYDPQQGQVCLGGVDLRQAALAPLRARVGLVTQDVQLLSGTLRDNLCLFDARDSVPDEHLLDVLASLGLERWLARFPAGLDTMLSNTTLSAGEAQLVALARITLKDPGLIILDEASSRLDPATEALLGRALGRLLAGRTAVIIAHRLSTLARVDETLILEQGRVVEFGERASLSDDPGSRLARLLRSGLEEVGT